MINEVFYFKTESNRIFNQSKNKSLNENKIQNSINLKEKKIMNTSIYNKKNNFNEESKNKEKSEDIENIEHIIKNNLDYNKNKKKIILRKNSDSHQFQKLQKYCTDAILDLEFLEKPTKNLIIQKNKEESLIINPDYISSEKKIIKQIH